MAKSSKKKGKKGSASVNFKGTDSGGRSIKDGWAVGKIVEAELTTAKESGNEMFKIVIQAKRGKEKAKVWDNLVLTQSALWKMRSLLEAAGVDIDEDEDYTYTADDLLDLEEFDVELVNEEYENRLRPRVVSFATLGTHTDDEGDEDEDEEEDEDEKPTKRLKKKASKSDDDDEDEDEDEDEEDEDDDSDDDDEDEDEEDEDEPPAKSKKKSKKSSKDDDEDEEEEDDDSDEDDDEDDEDEDEKPKTRSIRDKKGKKSKTKLRAGQKVKFEDDKGRTKSGVITSVDDDTVFVEDAKGGEWELSTDEIIS